MISISVIIPVYNSARYLVECLESVVAQTFSNLEIICINDGSTDNSLGILQEFQKRDARIIIVNQRNRGVSAARNAGLDVAAGKYIGFVDSDDTLERNFFQQLWNVTNFQEVDVVFAQGINGSKGITSEKTYSRNEILEQVLPLYFKEDFYNAIWNKLYSAALIRKHDILFPPGKTHGEDAVFNIKFLMHATSMCTVDYSGYHYRETPGSATRNITRFDYLRMAVETFEEDWTSVVGKTILPCTLHRLKKERFINNVISQIYLCSDPENGLPFRTKWRKLVQIVRHPLVKQLFNENNQEITAVFSKYKKEIYRGVQSRSTIKLYLLSLYSYYRSK